MHLKNFMESSCEKRDKKTEKRKRKTREKKQTINKFYI